MDTLKTAIIESFISAIDKYKIVFKDEKDLQQKIDKILTAHNIAFKREYRLDDSSIVDFYIDGVAFEIKIKGQQKTAVHRQCKRYLEFEGVDTLVLITSFSMGMPSEINGKPVYLYRLN